ncbi:MAG: hypothetical protein VB877_12955, partial [Pirellulaceae bacterium]
FMAIPIECPACDESFNVPDDSAGKKVKCPACGNISRTPGKKKTAAAPQAMKKESHSKTAGTHGKSPLQVAQRLPEDGVESQPSPPPITPPQRKPPMAAAEEQSFLVLPDEQSKVSINRDPDAGTSVGGEKHSRRKKTSPIWLWGTIMAGGATVIGLAIFANHLNNPKTENSLATKNSRTPSDSTGGPKKPLAPAGQDNQPGKIAEKVTPGQNTPPNDEPFAPFEQEKQPVNDPLINEFKKADNPPPEEPVNTGGFTPDAVQALFEQCQELQWNPETLEDYAKLQGLAKLVADCGRAQESEILEADQKEEMLKASLRVMDSLSTIAWPDPLQVTRINKLATEALQNQQELGVFAYSEVYVQADGQLDGANILFFKLPGTDQHVAITVKENSGELTPGTRWLILGEFNFQRTIQLMDNNTGNTIKAPQVTAYYLIQEPK